LDNIHVEPSLDRLQGISRKRYGISLCLVVNNDSISGFEGTKGHPIYRSYEESMLSSKIHKLVAYCAQGKAAR
jgi:hypothetical protein